jgi:lipopolysaccharide/colanic/teichoic acid biosynthesis glycosyltransferase
MRMKRLFDLFVAITAAVVWVPVLLGSSLMVLVMSGRPVFYRSNRWVRTGQMVRTVKFRTMVKNADKVANRTTVPVEGVRFLNIPSNSPLYTSVGRVLERCGITELPQFLHVLRGQMSIVGNRPLPDNVMQCLREDYPYADDRFLTPAGLTGPVQLVGRDALSDSERLRIEGAYCLAVAHGYRLRLDFSILLSTVLIVAHVKAPLDYQGVMDLIERYAKPARERRVREVLVEDAMSSDIA